MHSCFSNFEKKTLFLFTRQSLIQRNYRGKLNCGIQSSAAEFLLDGGATNDEIDEITLSVSLYISQSLYLSLSLSLNLSIFISFSILFSFSFSLLPLLYGTQKNMANWCQLSDNEDASKWKEICPKYNLFDRYNFYKASMDSFLDTKTFWRKFLI